MSEIPYLLCGSVASSFHGEPRATKDINLVLNSLPNCELISDLKMRAHKMLAGGMCWVSSAMWAELQSDDQGRGPYSGVQISRA